MFLTANNKKKKEEEEEEKYSMQINIFDYVKHTVIEICTLTLGHTDMFNF